MLRGERSTAILGLDRAIETRMTQCMHSAYPLSESNAEESSRDISAPDHQPHEKLFNGALCSNA
jgi:hypothetical protein